MFNYNAPCGSRQAPVTPSHAVQVRACPILLAASSRSSLSCLPGMPCQNHMHASVDGAGLIDMPALAGVWRVCARALWDHANAEEGPKFNIEVLKAQGVKLVFYDDDSDMLLLQQLSQIPKEFAPYYVGARACLSALAHDPCSC